MYPIDLLFISFLIYVPALVMLYLIVIWVILTKKALFRSSFYRLFITSAVSDIVMVTATFVPLRCPVFPMMNFMFVDISPSTYWRQFLTAVTFMCPFTQDLLNCFIALNRLTSIARPFKHAEIWRNILPYTIAASIIRPFSLFFLQTFRPVNYLRIPLGEYDIYFPDGSVHIFPWFQIHRISAATQLITAITEGVLYSLAYRLLRRSVAKHQDRVILRFGVISLLVSCPGIIMQTIPTFELSKSASSPVFSITYALPIDVKFFSPLIIMLFVNPVLRREVIKTGRVKISITSVATTSSRI